VQGDAHRLPMAGGSADLIVSIESALHLADKPAFLASCRRVLRPGGTLCVADMTAGRAIAVLAAAGTRLPRRLRCGAHLWNAERYEAAIAAAGLDLVRHESIRAGVAAALARGVRDIAGDWAALDGCRTRAAWAMALAALFTTRALGYDLFVARRPR
jgi:SAM-dependent methyltransferase